MDTEYPPWFGFTPSQCPVGEIMSGVVTVMDNTIGPNGVGHDIGRTNTRQTEAAWIRVAERARQPASPIASSPWDALVERATANGNMVPDGG